MENYRENYRIDEINGLSLLEDLISRISSDKKNFNPHRLADNAKDDEKNEICLSFSGISASEDF